MKKAKIIRYILKKVKDIIEYDRFIELERPSNLKSKLALQLIIAFSFFVLSIANIVAEAYYMLILTASGFITNTVFALVALKKKSRKLSAYSSMVTCSLLFASFVICGGNDGFACLWVVLLPLLSMIIMDFKFGFCTSLFFQIFLIVVFWTPVNENLLYEYNEQFCLRFPLFFFVTFMLGFLLTASLKQSEYNESRHLIELEEMNDTALQLSRTDYLTKLANRRYSYEQLEGKFADSDVPHCIVMGDIDNFKHVNDLYGHDFGDEVLITISQYITDILPAEYLKSRWGGEEFLIAANESTDIVYNKVEELREAISSHLFSFNSVSVNITMTFGIAQYTDIKNISEAINLADKRLYIGKRMNKNCTVISEPIS